MLSQNEIIKTTEFWMEMIQNSLYTEVKNYIEKRNINQTQLADELGVTKGYVSQILKGNFNYTLKKLIELNLHIGKVPDFEFITFDEYMQKKNNHFNTISVQVNNEPFTITKGNAVNDKMISLTSQLSLSVSLKKIDLDDAKLISA